MSCYCCQFFHLYCAVMSCYFCQYLHLNCVVSCVNCNLHFVIFIYILLVCLIRRIHVLGRASNTSPLCMLSATSSGLRDSSEGCTGYATDYFGRVVFAFVIVYLFVFG
jgi:hypothetical protein